MEFQLTVDGLFLDGNEVNHATLIDDISKRTGQQSRIEERHPDLMAVGERHIFDELGLVAAYHNSLKIATWVVFHFLG